MNTLRTITLSLATAGLMISNATAGEAEPSRAGGGVQALQTMMNELNTLTQKAADLNRGIEDARAKRAELSARLTRLSAGKTHAGHFMVQSPEERGAYRELYAVRKEQKTLVKELKVKDAEIVKALALVKVLRGNSQAEVVELAAELAKQSSIFSDTRSDSSDRKEAAEKMAQIGGSLNAILAAQDQVRSRLADVKALSPEEISEESQEVARLELLVGALGELQTALTNRINTDKNTENRLNGEVNTLTASLKSVQEELAATQTQLATVKDQLKRSQEEALALKGQIDGLTTNLNKMTAERDTLAATVPQLQKQLADMESRFGTERTELNAKIKELDIQVLTFKTALEGISKNSGTSYKFWDNAEKKAMAVFERYLQNATNAVQSGLVRPVRTTVDEVKVQ